MEMLTRWLCHLRTIKGGRVGSACECMLGGFAASYNALVAEPPGMHSQAEPGNERYVIFAQIKIKNLNIELKEPPKGGTTNWLPKGKTTNWLSHTFLSPVGAKK